MTIKKPKIYANHQKCPLCLIENKTREYLFQYPVTQRELENIWFKAEEKLFSSEENEKNAKILEEKKHLIHKIRRRTINLL